MSLIIAFFAAPAGAHPTVISSLGEAPLIGELRSTNELTSEVFKQTPRLERAASELGLSHEQFDDFKTDVAIDENIRWVTIPRHLDAMSWQSGGRVHVIKDVVIPPRTHGWAVYLANGVTVYVPAKCGNLSVLRTPVKRVAIAPLPAAAPAAAPLPVLAPQAAVESAPPPAPAAPTEFPTPTPLAAVPPPAPVHHYFLDALGALLLPLIAVSAGGGGSSSGGGGSATPAGGAVGGGGGCMCH